MFTIIIRSLRSCIARIRVLVYMRISLLLLVQWFLEPNNRANIYTLVKTKVSLLPMATRFQQLSLNLYQDNVRLILARCYGQGTQFTSLLFLPVRPSIHPFQQQLTAFELIRAE